VYGTARQQSLCYDNVGEGRWRPIYKLKSLLGMHLNEHSYEDHALIRLVGYILRVTDTEQNMTWLAEQKRITQNTLQFLLEMNKNTRIATRWYTVLNLNNHVGKDKLTLGQCIVARSTRTYPLMLSSRGPSRHENAGFGSLTPGPRPQIGRRRASRHEIPRARVYIPCQC
jgi:hypothetical protein